MAEIDESTAVGAEKSPKRVGAFILILLVVLVILLGIVLLLIHHSGR